MLWGSGAVLWTGGLGCRVTNCGTSSTVGSVLSWVGMGGQGCRSGEGGGWGWGGGVSAGNLGTVSVTSWWSPWACVIGLLVSVVAGRRFSSSCLSFSLHAASLCCSMRRSSSSRRLRARSTASESSDCFFLFCRHASVSSSPAGGAVVGNFVTRGPPLPTERPTVWPYTQTQWSKNMIKKKSQLCQMFNVSWQITVALSSSGTSEPIVFSYLLKAQNKHERTSERILFQPRKDVNTRAVKLAEKLNSNFCTKIIKILIIFEFKKGIISVRGEKNFWLLFWGHKRAHRVKYCHTNARFFKAIKKTRIIFEKSAQCLK